MFTSRPLTGSGEVLSGTALARAVGPAPGIIVRRPGRVAYGEAWDAMRRFTELRDVTSPDEIWLLEHQPVFTLGQAGRREHLRQPGPIPVVASDRGGQVTYHGPGQLVVYVLLDLARRGLAVRRLVETLEQAVIDVLGPAGVCAARRSGAPGVYVDGRKVASVGLRVRRGRSYHGLSLNVDGDLAPFRRIDPCGYPGLEVTRLRDLGLAWGLAETGDRLLEALLALLGDGQEAEKR